MSITMTKETLSPRDALRRKLMVRAAAAGSLSTALTITPAAGLLLSAGNASAQAADPYASQLPPKPPTPRPPTPAPTPR